MMRQNSGFTLYELMAVIGIICILAALAVPSFLHWLPKRRLSEASKDVFSALQNARAIALKNNASVGLLFDKTTETYTVFIDNGAGANADNGTQDADEPTLESGRMPAGIDLVNTTLAGDEVFFDSRGILSNAGGKVSLKNRLNGTKVIEVIRTGNSRIL